MAMCLRWKMMTHHSKIEKKKYDRKNTRIGDLPLEEIENNLQKTLDCHSGLVNTVDIPDFKSGHIEINNDFSVLSKSVHDALFEQRDNAYKRFVEELGYIPINVVIESYPPTMEELPNGNLMFTTNFRFKEAEEKKMQGMRKYKVLDERKQIFDVEVYRIEATEDFGDVKKGDKGGFVQTEANLSHVGDCWIYDDAMVYNDAVVMENARIRDNATVRCDAIVRGYATVCDDARVIHNAIVEGRAVVSQRAIIAGNATISEHGLVTNDSIVAHKAQVKGDSYVRGNSEVKGYAVVTGKATVRDSYIAENAIVRGNTLVLNSSVYGNALIDCEANVKNADITENAVVAISEDYLVMHNIWSSGRFFTYTYSNGLFRVGCFTGTGAELIKKAYQDNEAKGKFYENAVRYVENVYNIREEV